MTLFEILVQNGLYCLKVQWCPFPLFILMAYIVYKQDVCTYVKTYIKNRYQTKSFFWRDISSISHFWFNVSDYSLVTVNKASEYIMVLFFRYFSQSYWFCSYWISSKVFPGCLIKCNDSCEYRMDDASPKVVLLQVSQFGFCNTGNLVIMSFSLNLWFPAADVDEIPLTLSMDIVPFRFHPQVCWKMAPLLSTLLTSSL